MVYSGEPDGEGGFLEFDDRELSYEDWLKIFNPEGMGYEQKEPGVFEKVYTPKQK